MNKKITERVKNHISDFDKAIKELEKKSKKDGHRMFIDWEKGERLIEKYLDRTKIDKL